eukprot:TRINITY_DN14179_c0_g1_i17.p2 TRINITY_DN14179_c0_g1~~TRINITY_DN14179_c0_g1_i17.p2  ORF type:complete len:134 (-),score=20.00 TRINITY_DN14179_c0_g1_i17:122-523(-)
MVLLAFFDYSLSKGSFKKELLTLLLLFGAAVSEMVVYFCKPLKFARGFFIMSYIYGFMAFISHYTEEEFLYSPPMYFLRKHRKIPFYMCAFIIGVVYINTWITASAAAVIGLILQILSASLTSIAWCTFSCPP